MHHNLPVGSHIYELDEVIEEDLSYLSYVENWRIWNEARICLFDNFMVEKYGKEWEVDYENMNEEEGDIKYKEMGDFSEEREKLEENIVRTLEVKNLVEPKFQGIRYIFDNMLDAAKCCYNLNKQIKHFDCDRSYNITYDSNNKICVTNFSKSVSGARYYGPKNAVHAEEIPYEGYVYDLTTDNHHFAAGVGNMIVHNTDSVFFKFNLLNKETGEPILGHKALELSIEIAQSACHTVSKFLKQPHDFEYEKTFMPFCLLSKKRYVGILYETDPNKGKRKEMGIVLKRRDNAPIVKDVYGGVIDILMKECNVQKAIEYVNRCLQEMVDGQVAMDKLIITKSLRSFYKNPQQIAHKVLADRIAAREPGNKPTSGDRIPFAYIIQANKKALQGEKIETPTYIKEKGLQLDYSFYITNQIMKPLLQLFGLVLEDIWRMQNKSAKISKFRREIAELRREQEDNKKFEDKLAKMKDKEVKTLIFDKYLRETNNAKEGNQSVAKFFTKK
jgi:hypothetical protein